MGAHPRSRLAGDWASRETVNSMDSPQEFSLTAVAGMSDRARSYSKTGERDMSIASNRDHGFGAQGVQQPSQQRLASFTLFSRIVTIRHWIVRGVGVQREDIPQKDGALQLFDHGPDHRRGSLTDRWPLRRSRQLWRPEKRGVRGKVNFV